MENYKKSLKCNCLPQPAFRKLRGYAFDPSFSSTIDRRQSNEVTYKVRWEDTEPGPCGEYVEIIDYDPTKQCFYEPVDLNDSYVLTDHGMPLSEGDPRFHQQQVYAVVMNVISQFEKALGRKIIWSRIENKKREKDRVEYKHHYIDKLRIYPHGFRQKNAYYSPKKFALLFGYFQASDNWAGNNIPGAAIFTCLSPDIVAHEVTHAILDCMHPYLSKNTNPDMLAFHEGFPDVIALLQRFTFREVVEDQIRNSRGDLLSPNNLLGDLAIQFGQTVSSNRRALRSFLVENDEKGNWKLVDPDPKKYHTIEDPHARGGLLVAAVFNAFTGLYRFETADLLRLASNGSGILAPGEIDPDLVKRLSREACEIANKLMLICIRALDYCPPADLTFGDYLRALITADIEHNPNDEEGLRFALIESFRKWGIVPDNLNTYSVDSLKWKSLEYFYAGSPKIQYLNKAIHSIFGDHKENITEEASANISQKIECILREDDRLKIFEHTKYLCGAVHEMIDNKFYNYDNYAVSEGLEELLGMSFIENLYTLPCYDSKNYVTVKAKARDVFQVYRCRPVIRHNNLDDNVSKVLLITFLQKVYVNLKETIYQGYFPNDKYAYGGGSTLVIDLVNFNIKYAIVKSIASEARLRRQLDYVIHNYNDHTEKALLMQDDEPFAALHLQHFH